MRDRLVDALGHLVHGQVGDGAVLRRGADEGVDARGPGVFHRLPAAVDILEVGARQPADRGLLRQFGDLGDGGEIAVGRDGKSRLDDVDAHVVEQRGDLQLFLVAHGRAGRLLAVAQRRVEDQDAIGVDGHVDVFLS